MYQPELYHYGIKRRSGRYPWGSGDRPYQSEEKNKQNKTTDWYLKRALYVVGSISVSYAGYKLANNKDFQRLMYDIIKKVGDKKIPSKEATSDIYSKSLGRMLSISEAIDLGFM